MKKFVKCSDSYVDCLPDSVWSDGGVSFEQAQILQAHLEQFAEMVDKTVRMVSEQTGFNPTSEMEPVSVTAVRYEGQYGDGVDVTLTPDAVRTYLEKAVKYAFARTMDEAVRDMSNVGRRVDADHYDDAGSTVYLVR